MAKGQEAVFFNLFEIGFTSEQVANMTSFELKKIQVAYEKWKKNKKEE